MTFDECNVQDAQTETIIRRGTELWGLYYVDEMTQHGQAMITHESPKTVRSSFRLSKTFASFS